MRPQKLIAPSFIKLRYWLAMLCVFSLFICGCKPKSKPVATETVVAAVVNVPEENDELSLQETTLALKSDAGTIKVDPKMPWACEKTLPVEIVLTKGEPISECSEPQASDPRESYMCRTITIGTTSACAGCTTNQNFTFPNFRDVYNYIDGGVIHTVVGECNSPKAIDLSVTLSTKNISTNEATLIKDSEGKPMPVYCSTGCTRLEESYSKPYPQLINGKLVEQPVSLSEKVIWHIGNCGDFTYHTTQKTACSNLVDKCKAGEKTIILTGKTYPIDCSASGSTSPVMQFKCPAKMTCLYGQKWTPKNRAFNPKEAEKVKKAKAAAIIAINKAIKALDTFDSSLPEEQKSEIGKNLEELFGNYSVKTRVKVNEKLQMIKAAMNSIPMKVDEAVPLPAVAVDYKEIRFNPATIVNAPADIAINGSLASILIHEVSHTTAAGQTLNHFYCRPLEGGFGCDQVIPVDVKTGQTFPQRPINSKDKAIATKTADALENAVTLINYATKYK